MWVCAALYDGDRAAARQAPDGRLDRAGHDTAGMAVRMLDIDPTTFHRAYNAIANSTLWFVHHLLYAIPTAPDFDAGFRREWASYETYNQAFAEALAEEAAEGAKVLVQDYHLTLLPRLLRDLRPDLRIAHFSHTPWAPVDYFRLLPDDVARETLVGMLGADHVGFHSARWAQAFAACCAEVLGAETSDERGHGTTGARLTSACTRSVSTRPLCIERAHERRRRDPGHRAARPARRPAGHRAGRPDRAVEEHRPRPARLPRAAPALPGVAAAR